MIKTAVLALLGITAAATAHANPTISLVSRTPTTITINVDNPLVGFPILGFYIQILDGNSTPIAYYFVYKTASCNWGYIPNGSNANFVLGIDYASNCDAVDPEEFVLDCATWYKFKLFALNDFSYNSNQLVAKTEDCEAESVKNDADLEIVATTQTNAYLKVMAGSTGIPDGFTIQYRTVNFQGAVVFPYTLRPFKAAIVAIPDGEFDCGTIFDAQALVSGGRPSNSVTGATQNCQP